MRIALPARAVSYALSLAALGAALVLVGCGGTSPQPVAVSSPAAGKPPAASAPAGEEHGHKPGSHGGILVAIGRDSYHAEAVFVKGGVLRLHMLGNDESRLQEVESQTLAAFARPDGGNESLPFELKPEPQPGDAAGTTTLFVGKLPDGVAGKKVEVTVPNVRIKGERFRLNFQSSPPADDGHTAAPMPTKATTEEERALYLTPGGLYTQADIAANGGLTASQKFRGKKSEHDMHPKAGDRICPVTETKASDTFTWQIGGKPYRFCCPPCVDEFVKTAKENPQAVKPPETYVKP